MSRFAVIVEFVVRTGQTAAFKELIVANASASVADEPGCHRFDVLVDQADEDTVVLYEIYEDEAAFAEHSKSAHYLTFAEASLPLVQAKTVRSLRIIATPEAGKL
ncbi:putative quinol monooxygenase [Alsobacter sp. SYSU BS001988]